MTLRILRWFGLGIAGLLAVVALALGILVAAGVTVDVSFLRPTVEAVAQRVLNRRVHIDGELRLVPTLKPTVEIAQLRIANPDGWSSPDLLRLQRMRAGLSVLPLLGGQVEIDEVMVSGLEIELEEREDGTASWLLGRRGGAAAGDDGAALPGRSRALTFVELRDLLLEDIVIRYRGGTGAPPLTFKLNDVRGSVVDDEPMQLAVQGAVQRVNYGLSLTGGTLEELLDGGKPWPLDLSAAATGINLHLSGEIADPLRGNGVDMRFAIKGTTVDELQRLVGSPLPPFGEYEIEGQFQAADGVYAFEELRGVIGNTSFTGSFPIDLSGERPRVTGRLEIAAINLAPFQELMTGSRAAQDAAPPATEPGDAASPITLDTPLLVLDVLHDFDADLGVTITEIRGLDSAPRNARLRVNVTTGLLTAPLAVEIADVPFIGQIDLSARDAQPRLGLLLVAGPAGIARLPDALFHAGGIQGGFTESELKITASGLTFRELLTSLDLRFALADARLSYGHEEGGRPVEFTLAAAEVRLPAGDALTISSKGSLLGEPFMLSLTGGDAMQIWLDRRWPIAISFTGDLSTRLDAKGVVAGLTSAKGSRLDVVASAKQIGNMGNWIGVSPDTDLPFSLRTRVTHTPSETRIEQIELQLGRTRIQGAMGRRGRGVKEILFATLNAAFFDAAEWRDLLSADSGAKSKEEAAPSFSLDVPILPHGIDLSDADLDLAVTTLRTRRADVEELAISARIRDGHMQQAPFKARLLDVGLAGSIDLDLRGGEPELRFDVAARSADLGRVLKKLGIADNLRIKAGKARFELALSGRSARQMLETARVSGLLENGSWTLMDANTGGQLEIALPRGSLRSEPGRPVTLELDGRIQQTPAQIWIRTDPLDTFTEDKKQLSLSVGAEVAGAQLQIDARSRMPLRDRDADFRLQLEGERLDSFDELLHVDLPPWGPYAMEGVVRVDDAGYRVDELRLQVADSRLTGDVAVNTRAARPRLEVDLVSDAIQLDDFGTGDWSLIETAAAPAPAADTSDASLQERAAEVQALLSPEVLRSLDARIGLDVQQVSSGTDRLGRGYVLVFLEDGRFSVEPAQMEVPGGSVEFGLAYEPSDDGVSAELHARVDRLDYGILARRAKPDADIDGRISVDVDLKAHAPDMERLMAQADGHIELGIWPQDFEAGVFDLWAVNLLAAVLPTLDTGPQSTVNCVIARFALQDGIATPSAILVDSTRVQASGIGSIDFKDERIELVLRPQAKRPQMFSAATPIQVSGDFADFGVGVDPGDVIGTVVRMATSIVVVPFQWVFSQPLAADGQAACAEAWGRVKATD